MKVFKENLLAGADLMTENYRWPSEYFPQRFGTLDCLNQFDNVFFNMIPRQADSTDPQIRLLIEVAFEAVLDAGKTHTHTHQIWCGARIYKSLLICGKMCAAIPKDS